MNFQRGFSLASSLDKDLDELKHFSGYKLHIFYVPIHWILFITPTNTSHYTLQRRRRAAICPAVRGQGRGQHHGRQAQQGVRSHRRRG